MSSSLKSIQPLSVALAVQYMVSQLSVCSSHVGVLSKRLSVGHAKNDAQEPMSSSFLRQRPCRNSNMSSATGAPDSAIGMTTFAIFEKASRYIPNGATVQDRVKYYRNLYALDRMALVFGHLERPIITTNHTTFAMQSPVRLPVVCLSVTLMHPTQ